MTTLRTRLIRLAHSQPELRPHLLPLLKTGRRFHAASMDTVMSMTSAKEDMETAARMLVDAEEAMLLGTNKLRDAYRALRDANINVSDDDTDMLERNLKGFHGTTEREISNMVRRIQEYQNETEDAIEQYESEIAYERSNR